MNIKTIKFLPIFFLAVLNTFPALAQCLPEDDSEKLVKQIVEVASTKAPLTFEDLKLGYEKHGMDIEIINSSKKEL